MEQSRQIETSAADYHRQPAPTCDIGQNLACKPCVFTRGVTLLRIQHVEEVMGDGFHVRGGGLRCSNIEAAVNLHGIAVHGLAMELARDRKTQSALPGTC